jgi:2-amino-4-hydroxy-6-hydroxymethyldihydropteridine diphosphokinase
VDKGFTVKGDFHMETRTRKQETSSAVHKMAYLSLGSNVGERAPNLKAAIDRLGSLGAVAAVSSFYETEPIEFTAQPWFLNCAVKLNTEKMPRQLLNQVLHIEKKMGRRRVRDKGPRIIDIDILLFGNSIIATKGLTIPHPAMHTRRFVLEPLAEIAPDLRHPVFKRSVRELRDALPAGQMVKCVGKF